MRRQQAGMAAVRMPNRNLRGGSKRCTSCGCWKPIAEFGPRSYCAGSVSNACRLCEAARQLARNVSTENRRRRRSATLKYKYGITLEDYEARLAFQGGVCAICQSDHPGAAGTKRPRLYFTVDHDHETGLIRGLLCHGCNVALGYAKENVDALGRMIEYLEAGRFLREVSSRGPVD